MKIIVTGGAGFIGSHVVDLLMSQNVEVLVLDNFSSGHEENLDQRVAVEHCDVTTSLPILEVFQRFKPDAVVHMAAQPALVTSWKYPLFDAYTNIQGTLNVIMAAKGADVKHFVFASTSAVYDEDDHAPLGEDDRLYPACPYGVSKLAAESYVRMLFPAHSILRFGNVYGPRQVPLGENQVIPRMIRHFEKGDKFYIHGDGTQKRDYIFVEDVALAVFKALVVCGTFNIASGVGTSVNDLASMLEEIYDVKGYEWQHDDPIDTRSNTRMGVNKALKFLDWQPRISPMVGLKNTVEWWKTQ